jgi:hypothetical protein
MISLLIVILTFYRAVHSTAVTCLKTSIDLEKKKDTKSISNTCDKKPIIKEVKSTEKIPNKEKMAIHKNPVKNVSKSFPCLGKSSDVSKLSKALHDIEAERVNVLNELKVLNWVECIGQKLIILFI